MEKSGAAKNAAWAKVAHDTQVDLRAQPFFNDAIAIPTNGCDASAALAQGDAWCER